MRGLFITVEGIDGCGKSTFAKGLAARLELMGKRVSLTAEPTNSWLGDAVRRSWSSGSGPLVEAYLFMADRVAHTGSIKKSLASGRMVISDRYLDSTLAYQGSALADAFDGGLPSAIEWLRRASPPSTLVPDITFFLKISPRVSLKRIEVRQSRTKFERFECLRRVGEAFELLASQRRFVTLDAMRPPESLVDCAVASLRRRKLT